MGARGCRQPGLLRGRFQNSYLAAQADDLALLRLNLPELALDLGALLPHLLLLVPDLLLLLLDRFDQKRCQPAVVHALRVFAVLFVAHNFGNDLADFFGNDADFVLAAAFQVVGDAAQLFDFCQRVGQGLNIGLPAAGAVGDQLSAKAAPRPLPT